MWFSPAFCPFLFGPVILVSALFSINLNMRYFLNARVQISQIHKTAGRNMVLYIINVHVFKCETGDTVRREVPWTFALSGMGLIIKSGSAR
jgi:hypothetical protein